MGKWTCIVTVICHITGLLVSSNHPSNSSIAPADADFHCEFNGHSKRIGNEDSGFPEFLKVNLFL